MNIQEIETNIVETFNNCTQIEEVLSIKREFEEKIYEINQILDKNATNTWNKFTSYKRECNI